MEKYFGESIKKLGFGLMRLPKEEGSEKIDIEHTKKMVDMFMEAGLTYFDTAYVYNNGESEAAIRKALVDRYPRESYTMATKLNPWHGATDAESAKQQFFTSLERLGVGYIDFYLLHCIMDKNVNMYDDYGLWDFVAEQKQKGLIRHVGFSFHGSSGLLDKLLTAHPEMDFIQLQLNYADWDDSNIESRRNWEVARAHGVSVVVMEPVKGGALAVPPTPVQEVFRKADPNASFASWAIRFAASLDGVITVLSGMSNVEQMADNLSYMKDFKPLSEAEQQVIRDAQDALNSIDQIRCTACHYCTEGCPMQIRIPEIFAARNQELVWEKPDKAEAAYKKAIDGTSAASQCLACGQCESACPQSLPIIDLLKECAERFE